MIDNLVSVVLPVRNREDVVAVALLSVLRQTYRELEVLVVDDGCTDRSMAEIARVADSRVVVIENRDGCGASVARNVGIARAQGRYVAFQDSDDWWHPDKLSHQMALLRSPAATDVAAVGCRWEFMQPNGALSLTGERGVGCSRFSRQMLLPGCVSGIGTPMLVIDRVRATGPLCFNPQFLALEEADFLYRCLPEGPGPLAVLDRTLVAVRRGRRDHVANATNALAGYAQYLQTYSAELASHPVAEDWYRYRACREALIIGDKVKAAEYKSAITSRSIRLELEYRLGCWLGVTGLKLATKAKMKPRFSRRCSLG